MDWSQKELSYMSACLHLFLLRNTRNSSSRGHRSTCRNNCDGYTPPSYRGKKEVPAIATTAEQRSASTNRSLNIELSLQAKIIERRLENHLLLISIVLFC